MSEPAENKIQGLMDALEQSVKDARAAHERYTTSREISEESEMRDPMDDIPRTLPKEAVFAFCRRPPDWQATTMREVFGMDVQWPGNVKDMMRHLRETNQRQAFIDYMASLTSEDPG